MLIGQPYPAGWYTFLPAGARWSVLRFVLIHLKWRAAQSRPHQARYHTMPYHTIPHQAPYHAMVLPTTSTTTSSSSSRPRELGSTATIQQEGVALVAPDIYDHHLIPSCCLIQVKIGNTRYKRLCDQWSHQD